MGKITGAKMGENPYSLQPCKTSIGNNWG